ncbi:MAG: hypothetical protein P4L43_01115 [Syntrophobacteraceae bacterium]|nr:hypothetical protein [Syntrophobacteraceae bacterium]
MLYSSPKGKTGHIDHRVLVSAVPIVDDEKNATLELMKQLPDMTAYGMLLLDDPNHPMAQLVRERWSEIGNMTGDKFLLFSFERPEKWTKTYLKYWRNKLGDQFDAMWKEWQEVPDPGAAYGFVSLFKPPLTPKQLPCLVLFTDAEKRKAVVRPIPNWEKNDLYELLKAIATVVQDAATKPKEERLDYLRDELSSPGARFGAAAGHIGAQALDYFRQHPALVVSTAISVVLGLSGAGLLMLPAAAIAVLNILKETISGAGSKA